MGLYTPDYKIGHLIFLLVEWWITNLQWMMAYLSCKLTISKLRLSHYIILMTQQEHSYHENLQINFQGPTDGHSTQKSLQIWKEEVDIYVLLKKLCQIFLRWKLPYIKSLTILSDLTLHGKHLRVLVQILLYNRITTRT